MIFLDTSFLIRGLVRDSAEDRALRKWLRRSEVLGMSAVAWTELLCGPIDDTQHEFAAGVVSLRVAFTEEDAVLAARLFNETGRRRGSLIDCMIAATALRAREPLATSNAADFRRFATYGLAVLEA
ncbi:MAG: PIN domain-containing protein [Thermoanaerobaculia bacterium]|nr:PIN domain-containing protein [Thermoanaerobaculia bacterium]MBP9824519.1 PIN domain-containing protein [Thermoanaerobaculia bacterium]